MTETIRIGNIGKLWMPVPREWDGIGMSNVEVVSISPPPDDLYEDDQGNLIAFWDAGYRGSTDYSIVFSIDLAPIKYRINPDSIGEYDTSSWEYQRYTQPSEWVQSSDEAIVELAHRIVGDEENPYIQARLVHRWVVTNIEGGDVADAVTTLERRAAGCGGRSWLFVALLRALGIPARGVGGLHPDPGKDYFTSGDARSGTLYGHIWSEFYLPGYGWIQCDAGDLRYFAGIIQPRIVMFRGEDIELGHGYPLGTVPWFTIPNRDVLDASTPPTQTWGENLTLAVECLGSLAQYCPTATPPPPTATYVPVPDSAMGSPLTVLPDPLFAGQPTVLTVVVGDPSYVGYGGRLTLFVKPYGSTPQDVSDRDAPELLDFIIAAPTGGSFYKDGVAYVGIDLPLTHQGEVWVGQLSLVPIQGMALSARNASDTDGCVVELPAVFGTPPPDYPIADSGE